MGIINAAGLVILFDDEILLVHPTNAPWKGTYSIPKGKIEDFETILEAAIRETREEIGIDFSKFFMQGKLPDGVILYKRNKNAGKTYKKVFYYVVRIYDKKPVINQEKLQKEEVDWAGFVPYKEAKKKIFWRFHPFLELIKDEK